MASIGSGRANSLIGREAVLACDGRERRRLHQIGRHLDGGEFRNVGVVRHEAQHAGKPDAGAEPVDQRGEILRVVGGIEAGLLRRERLRNHDRKPDHVEAEAGIVRIADSGEALREQAADERGVADRPAGRRREAQHVAVEPEQHDLDEARAFAVLLEPGAQAVAQPLDGAEHVAFERDRLGKALLGDVARQRLARRDRFLVHAQGLVETQDQLGPEAGGERRTGASQEIGNVFQADLSQQGHDLGRKPQRRERQGRQGLARLARRHDETSAE
jgi:hypothetical protein